MIRAIGTGLALLAGLNGGGAVAMTSSNDPSIHCTVRRAEKLPQELNADALCTTVRDAAATALNLAGLKRPAVTVLITVDSERKLSAAATLNGRALPEHSVGVSDRALNQRAVDMLAAAIAAELTSARQ